MAAQISPGFASVILAGGTAARLDGVDKASIEVEGRTLLARAIDAAADATEVVVVGDAVATERPVTFTRENPRLGGPVAGLLTGRDALLGTPRSVVVQACDMPWVTGTTIRRLLQAGAGREGAVLVGPDGRRQLLFCVDVSALDRVRPDREAQHGAALQPLLRRWDLVEVPARGEEHRDIDSWVDLRDLDS